PGPRRGGDRGSVRPGSPAAAGPGGGLRIAPRLLRGVRRARGGSPAAVRGPGPHGPGRSPHGTGSGPVRSGHRRRLSPLDRSVLPGPWLRLLRSDALDQRRGRELHPVRTARPLPSEGPAPDRHLPRRRSPLPVDPGGRNDPPRPGREVDRLNAKSGNPVILRGSMTEKFNPEQIDGKWQRRGGEHEGASVGTAVPGEKFSRLNMFRYRSGGRLHVGHGRNYILGDALYRRERMGGRVSFNPMGWDAFGLPAENAAIASGIHPRVYTMDNIARMKEQLKSLGLLYDWSKELASCDPRYYRWNQWLFLRMWEKGLAYRKTAPVNWCPGCRTVLANAQVVGGRCDRSGDPVEIRDLTQWFFRITQYADRLLAGLDGLDWSDRVKTMQRNWIGRSEGAEILFALEGLPEPVAVFTTRPD